MALQVSLRNFQIEGSSMSPTLNDGQFLVVDKVSFLTIDRERLSRAVPFWQAEKSRPAYPFSTPGRGDIVVFSYPRDPTKDFVKRVIGLPGETVEVRSGTVYVDGVALEEPYLWRPGDSDVQPVTLRDDEYYVIGDNRRNSNDSRVWGPVPEENILGRVWLVYWPWEDFHVVDSQ